jgi:hypothetical protein
MSDLPEPFEDFAESAHSSMLHSLVLEVPEDLELGPQVRRFLAAFAKANGEVPDDFGLPDYLDRIWPDGLTTTLYASNIGMDPNAPRHRLRVLLRPAREGPHSDMPAVGSVTLALRAKRKQGKLAIEGVEVTPHAALRDFEARVSAPMIWQNSAAYMLPVDLDALRSLPFHRAEAAKRLTAWHGYLDWMEKLIKSRQVSLHYLAWRQDGPNALLFLTEASNAPLPPGLEIAASTELPVEDGPGEARARRAKDSNVSKLGQIESVRHSRLEDRQDWNGVEVRKQHRIVRVRLDEDHIEEGRELEIPDSGFLVSAIAGDLAPLHNQRHGVDRLMKSQGFSPRLADFLFDSSAASVPAEVLPLPPLDEARQLNPGQAEAVAKALSAPDLCLIQGPPGTGKTTVIADICLRATREGKRVLVASQTNLAVDNALSRLAGVPWVRPLRKGKKASVDEEFRAYLEENVVHRWFDTVVTHCGQRLERSTRDERGLTMREAAVQQLDAAFRERAGASRDLAAATESSRAARIQFSRLQVALQTSRNTQLALTRRAERLAALIQWADHDGPLPMDAAQEAWPNSVELPSEIRDHRLCWTALESYRSRLHPLLELRKALDAALHGASADPAAATQLKALRIEKQPLIDSDSAADMDRLRAINKRILELEHHGWNQTTGALGRAARRAFPESLPSSLHKVIDSLAPSPAVTKELQTSDAMLCSEIDRARAADACASASAPAWRQRHASLEIDQRNAADAVASDEQHLKDGRNQHEAAMAAERYAEASLQSTTERWNASWLGAGCEAPAPKPSGEALEHARQTVAATRAQLRDSLQRAAKWRDIQSEWLTRIRAVSEEDVSALQKLYVRHSNVVGMTCNEAGKWSTWQDDEFEPYDIVIVDEVSKATPPELILPMLLGEKAILVGDHRQLPPMFRERDGAFQGAVEDGEVREEELETYKRMVTASLFQELFEQAADSIKATLWTQYRMHPDVMDAVNQFYEGRLEAGPTRQKLAAARSHHLDVQTPAGKLVSPDQHLIWIDSSRGPAGEPAWEEQHGSSKVNGLEVQLVVDCLLRLGEALVAQGYGATRKVAVGANRGDMTWFQALRSALPKVPEHTLRELFAERRVRMQGNALAADGTAHEGEVEVRSQKEVGVITIYGAQLKALRRRIDAARSKYKELFASMDLRTNTVDRFQGMEKPIIIVSLVRSKPNGGLGRFVREYQRINVAISRAQQLLVVVGAEETWDRVAVPLPSLDGDGERDVRAYHEILELARRRGGRRLAREVIIR